MNQLLETVKQSWHISCRNTAFKDISFDDIMTYCLNNGAVTVKQGIVLLAKPCWTDGITTEFDDIKPANCWFIYAAGCADGNAAKRFCDEAPYKTEYVAYVRKGKNKIVKWSQLDRNI